MALKEAKYLGSKTPASSKLISYLESKEFKALAGFDFTEINFNILKIDSTNVNPRSIPQLNLPFNVWSGQSLDHRFTRDPDSKENILDLATNSLYRFFTEFNSDWELIQQAKLDSERPDFLLEIDESTRIIFENKVDDEDQGFLQSVRYMARSAIHDSKTSYAVMTSLANMYLIRYDKKDEKLKFYRVAEAKPTWTSDTFFTGIISALSRMDDLFPSLQEETKGKPKVSTGTKKRSIDAVVDDDEKRWKKTSKAKTKDFASEEIEKRKIEIETSTSKRVMRLSTVE
jgi:hypothetical protein